MALRENIGTYEEEDKAFNLLTWLSWHLPVFVVASALLDLLLAVVYLKWLHPWKIILQEVSCNCVKLRGISPQEPEKWGPEIEKESLLVMLLLKPDIFFIKSPNFSGGELSGGPTAYLLLQMLHI